MRIVSTNLQWPDVLLASAYAQAGQLEQARTEAAQVVPIDPAFTIESYKCVPAHKERKDVEHCLDGLRGGAASIGTRAF